MRGLDRGRNLDETSRPSWPNKRLPGGNVNQDAPESVATLETLESSADTPAERAVHSPAAQIASLLPQDLQDRVADAYFGRLGTAAMRRTRQRIHWVCEHATGKRILDVRCGQGVAALLLGREGRRVLGLDVSPQAVSEALALLDNELPAVIAGVSFRCADFLSYDFGDERFDSVLMSEVLEHLIDPQAFLEKAATLLHAEGTLVVTVPFGIDDSFDHKRTYYLAEPYQLIASRFTVVEVEQLGDCLGLVALASAPGDRPARATTFSPDLVRKLERAFLDRERTLRDQQDVMLLQHREAQRVAAEQARAERAQASRARLEREGAREELAELRTRLAVAEERLAQASREVARPMARANAESAGEGLERELAAARSELHQLRSETERARSAANVAQSLRAHATTLAERANRRVEHLSHRLASATALEAASAERALRAEHLASRTQTTISYQLGHALIAGPKSPKGLVSRLGSLGEVYRESRRRRVARERKEALGPTPAPGGEIKDPAFPAGEASVGVVRNQATVAAVDTASIADQLASIKAAVIVGEATLEAYAPEAVLLQLTTANWERELEAFRPEVLFVEATPADEESPWQGRARETSAELRGVVAWCKARKIPTAFWDRDPGARERLLATARLFDHVFTTALGDVASYKAALGHGRVYLLPEGYQPRRSNPVEAGTRKAARPGTSPASAGVAVEAAHHPEVMVPGRVLELLGSGTVMVTSPSPNAHRVFGDLVIAGETAEDGARHLRELARNEGGLRRFALLGLRKVLAEHTCQERWAYLVAKLRGIEVPALLPRVLVTAYVKDQPTFERVLASYLRQRQTAKRLVVVVPDGVALTGIPHDGSVAVFHARESSLHRLGAIAACGELIAGMVANDYYGTNYLLDLALASRYWSGAAIGKAAYYAASDDGKVSLVSGTRRFRPVRSLAARVAVARAELVAGLSLREWTATLHSRQLEVESGLSIDEFNYCRNAVLVGLDDEVLAPVLDLPLADHGASMARLLEDAEQMGPAACAHASIPLGPAPGNPAPGNPAPSDPPEPPPSGAPGSVSGPGSAKALEQAGELPLQAGPSWRWGAEDRVDLTQGPRAVRLAVQGGTELRLTGHIHSSPGEKPHSALIQFEFCGLPGNASTAAAAGLAYSERIGAYCYLPTNGTRCPWEARVVIPPRTETVILRLLPWFARKQVWVDAVVSCELIRVGSPSQCSDASTGSDPPVRPKNGGGGPSQPQQSAARDLDAKAAKAEGLSRVDLLGKAFEVEPNQQRALRLVNAATQFGTLERLDTPLEFLRGIAPTLSSADARTVRHGQGYLRLLEAMPEVPPRQRVERRGPRRVAMVLHCTVPHVTNGYATRSHSILSALRAFSWEVLPVTRPGFPDDLFPGVSSEHTHEYEGVTYHHLDGADYREDAVPEYLEKAASRLEREFRQLDVAVVHAASAFTTGLPALIAARRLGLPFVYEVRGLWEVTRACTIEGWGNTKRFEIERALESLVAREADHVLTLTEGLRRELVLRGVDARRITLLPNGVDLDRFQRTPCDESLRFELGLCGEPVVGYVGSIVPYEGLGDLLRAVHELKECGVRLRVLIVGDGPALPTLRELARELDLNDVITFTGQVPFERAEAYYSLIDVAPFPRSPCLLTEIVSPLKPFEAMAKGVPVVASDVGALREIIREGQTGLLFKRGDPHDLARVLRQLLLSPGLRRDLAEAARGWVAEHRQWGPLVRRIEAVYDRLAAGEYPEQTRAPRRILVYGDVNLNLIDGSAIWATSIVQMLSELPGVEVWLLLKAPVQREVVLEVLRDIPNVVVVPPDHQWAVRGPMKQAEAAERLLELHGAVGFDVILVRGLAVAERLATEPSCAGHLLPYLVEVFQRPDPWDQPTVATVATIARASLAMLCQTESIRRRLAKQVPDARDRTVLLPPMIPGRARLPHSSWSGDRPLRLVYAGKFSPLWGSRGLFEAVRKANEDGPMCELHVYGDKVESPPGDPSFQADIREHLESPGVVWHRGMSRTNVLRELPNYDLGWAWRSPELEATTDEVSTKVLEYGSTGLPMLLQRNRVNESLLGADYPLFLADSEALGAVLRELKQDPSVLRRAAELAHGATAQHTFDTVLDRHLRPALAPVLTTPARGRTVLVAGHDLKFIAELMRSFRKAGYRLLIDQWSGHNRHDETRSLRLLRRADVVLCEWCLGNAEWYSKHVQAHQRLLVRFHRQELETAYPRQVDWSRVSRLVFIAPQVERAALDRFPELAGAEAQFIWNTVNADQLDRAKSPEARTTLGIVGVVPRMKRLDRALDLLERLVRVEPRFILRVKGKRAHEYPWMASRPEELQFFAEQDARIGQSMALGPRVHFDGHGSDMAAWYQQVGYILSVSDFEGSHVSVAEGMASGAIPIIVRWAGAELLYPRERCFPDIEAAAEFILSQTQRPEQEWAAEVEASKRAMRERCDVAVVAQEWLRLLEPSCEPPTDRTGASPTPEHATPRPDTRVTPCPPETLNARHQPN